MNKSNPGRIAKDVTLSGTQRWKFSAQDADVFAVHLEWAGTPTGAFTFWASCKNDPDESADTDWVQDTGVSFTAPAGSAGKDLQEIGNSGATYYMIKHVLSGGSGTLNIWVNKKKRKL